MYASKLATLATIVLLGACSSKAELMKQQTNAVIDFNQQQSDKFAARIDTLADVSACADDACRIAGKAIAGMATVTQKPGYMPMPVSTPTLLDRVVDGLVNRVLPLAVTEYGRGYGAKKNAEVEMAQWQAFGDAFASTQGTTPDYVITGSFNSSDDNSSHGDTITDSGNTTLNDSQNGDHAGRDIVGRDVIDNSGNIGTGNRQGSDGPIDNSDDGDDCEGSDCSIVTPPEAPEAPETPEG